MNVTSRCNALSSVWLIAHPAQPQRRLSATLLSVWCKNIDKTAANSRHLVYLVKRISVLTYFHHIIHIQSLLYKNFPLFKNNIYIYIIHAIKRREGNKKKGEVSVNESKNVFHTCSTCFLRVFHKHNTRPSMLLHSFLHSNVAAAVEISKVFHKHKRNL